MKNKAVIIIVAIVVLLGFYAIGTQRSLVTLGEDVDAAWGDIEVQYQRRADLIPNIIASVKDQASREQEIFTQIADARARLAGAGTVQEKIDANTEVGSALSRLMVVVENYPQLQQNQGFQDLRVQLEGTENRIAVARKYYNDKVKSYNKKIKLFPTNIMAGILGYSDEYPYITADEGAEKAPKY